jgi:nitroimidazol reductase NimA-like FMN-containing flavoprotein (pyridoxamine 5'-phosphate oxidase superfamily)
MVFDLSGEELKFLDGNECCRLATSFRNKPHVVPVCYVFTDGFFYVSTDYDTKKLRNVKNNNFVSLVVDIYLPQNHKGIVICGSAQLVEKGRLFQKIYAIFFNKFEWVRNDPWEECESPFLKIQPNSKVSWGLNKT